MRKTYSTIAITRSMYYSISDKAISSTQVKRRFYVYIKE